MKLILFLNFSRSDILNGRSELVNFDMLPVTEPKASTDSTKLCCSIYVHKGWKYD